jgi:hypothetical protein
MKVTNCHLPVISGQDFWPDRKLCRLGHPLLIFQGHQAVFAGLDIP